MKIKKLFSKYKKEWEIKILCIFQMSLYFFSKICLVSGQQTTIVNKIEVRAESIKMVLFFFVMNIWIYPTKQPNEKVVT